MNLEFKKINLACDYAFCVAVRRDAYVCSFHRHEGFERFLTGYHERMATRLASKEWHYLHVWQAGEIVGQLEFCTFSSEPDTGYIYLIYLTPQVRGQGLAELLLRYIGRTLRQAGCRRVVLSVSRLNLRALRFYRRCGWQYLGPNPKHAETDFYEYWLSDPT